MHLVTSGPVLPCSNLPCRTSLIQSVHGQRPRPQCVCKSPALAQRAHRCRRSGALARAASQDTPSPEQGQISSELMQQMKDSITSSLEADKVDVTDVYGDGRHVNIEVVSKVFEGQTSVKRQRLVYKVSITLSIDIYVLAT